jgi:hypothetical protein
MKQRIGVFAAFVFVLAAGSLLLAQSNLFIGTWTFNTAESKYTPDLPPQHQTRTWDAAGTNTVRGIAGTGETMSYSYPINGDGKEYPITGVVPNRGDKISSKRINANTFEANFTKAGKHVETATFVVSKDGKTLTITAKGILPTTGAPFTHVLVYNKP